jgi:threonine dehydratase
VSSIVLRDDDIVDAQRWLWQSLKLAVEPAAALPLAALRSGAWRAEAGQRICLVLCGANVDPATLV